MNKTESFSLIEVLIFVSVLSLFFVTAAMVLVAVMKNTTTNQNKIIATHYAEELVSWLQSEKEINWRGSPYNPIEPISSFTQQVSQPLTDFCFNSSPILAWPASTGASNCPFSLDMGFRRIATFSAVLADPTTSPGAYINQVSVSVSVEWKDGDRVYSVPINSVFSIWE